MGQITHVDRNRGRKRVSRKNDPGRIKQGHTIIINNLILLYKLAVVSDTDRHAITAHRHRHIASEHSVQRFRLRDNFTSTMVRQLAESVKNVCVRILFIYRSIMTDPGLK